MSWMLKLKLLPVNLRPGRSNDRTRDCDNATNWTAYTPIVERIMGEYDSKPWISRKQIPNPVGKLDVWLGRDCTDGAGNLEKARSCPHPLNADPHHFRCEFPCPWTDSFSNLSYATCECKVAHSWNMLVERWDKLRAISLWGAFLWAYMTGNSGEMLKEISCLVDVILEGMRVNFQREWNRSLWRKSESD
jgi:hypothetical protein